LAIEAAACKRSLQGAQERGDTLSSTMERLNTELSSQERQLELLADNKFRLTDSYSMFSKTLQKTESELAKAVKNKGRLQLTLAQIHKNIHLTSSSTQKVEVAIMSELQNQTGIEKQGLGAKRDGTKLKAQIYEKQAHISQLQNEVTRMKVEGLNVGAQNEELRADLEEFEKQVRNQNATVEKFEAEIKRQVDELSKKQSEMDLLNRKFNQLMEQHIAAFGAAEGAIGPMEATIHNLQKSIAEQEKESVELQNFWLKAQNDLVNMTKKIEEAREIIADSKMKRAILERKKTIINAQFEREEADICELQRSKRKIDADMIKINVLLSKHSKVQQQLEENNLDLEFEFRGRLKDAEMESLHLEQTIERLRDEKKKALGGLIDAE
jgi:chromosome segregation ATPase